MCHAVQLMQCRKTVCSVFCRSTHHLTHVQSCLSWTGRFTPDLILSVTIRSVLKLQFVKTDYRLIVCLFSQLRKKLHSMNYISNYFLFIDVHAYANYAHTQIKSIHSNQFKCIFSQSRINHVCLFVHIIGNTL